MERWQQGEPEVIQTDIGRMAYHVARARLIMMLAVVGLVVFCILAGAAALALGILAEWLSYR